MQISPEGTCTARFNRRHKLFGHLFSGRYKSLVVDAASPGYLRTVCEYLCSGGEAVETTWIHFALAGVMVELQEARTS